MTFDALFTQTDIARYLVEEKQAHYLAVLKRNHPTLFEEIRALPWAKFPLGPGGLPRPARGPALQDRPHPSAYSGTPRI
ncbi:hypothetical protein OHR68_19875 [Spirillospora sp. NBC_00431]